MSRTYSAEQHARRTTLWLVQFPMVIDTTPALASRLQPTTRTRLRQDVVADGRIIHTVFPINIYMAEPWRQ